MNSAEISQELSNLENSYKQALENHFQVEQAILELARDITNLLAKKRELQITESRSKHNLQVLKIDMSLLTKQFWSVKESGL